MSIPIRIHPFFWVLAALIGWLSTSNLLLTVVWMAVIFISVLVHEYGHASAALFFGQKATINLVALGGATQREGAKIKLWQEFLVVLNGPIFGFLLCALAFSLQKIFAESLSPMIFYTLSIAVYINFFWTIFNLLPVHPLDGGKLVQIVLEAMFGVPGIKFAVIASLFLSFILGLLSFAYGFFFIGSLFFFLMFENYQYYSSMKSMTQNDRNENITAQMKAADTAMKSGNFNEASGILEKVRNESGPGITNTLATQMLSLIFFRERRYSEAYDLVYSIKNKMTPEFLKSAQRIAYEAKQFDVAIEWGKTAFREIPDYEIAVINALSHAYKREAEPASGWLLAAYHEGCPDFRALLKQKEFDAIRSDPSFKKTEALSN